MKVRIIVTTIMLPKVLMKILKGETAATLAAQAYNLSTHEFISSDVK